MDFSEALRELKADGFVARTGWNGKGMYLFLVDAWKSEGSTSPRLPFVAMKTADGSIVPWLCSHTDMLAEDWRLVFPTVRGGD